MRPRWSPLVPLLFASVFGCSESTTPSEDAGHADAALADAGSGEDAAPDDAAPSDAGDRDLGVPDLGASDAGPVLDSCPGPSTYVGDAAWAGRLTTGGAYFCVYPRMYETAAAAFARKRRLQLVPGTFNFPLNATDAPFRLPACFEPKDGAPSPEIRLGTVSAELRQDWDDSAERYYVAALWPLSGDAGRLQLTLKVEPSATSVDLGGTITDFTHAQLTWCTTEDCFSEDDLRLLPCQLASNTCDELQLEGGSLMIDQFHWAGSVGAGFAAGLRVRGQLDGTPFDVRAYDQIQVTYGHHAFSRGLAFYFDAPIGPVCGLELEEIAESSTSPVAHLLDCQGARMGTRAVTGSQHRWQQACPL